MIPGIATAGEGEHVLSVRPEYVYSDGHGGGLSVGYQYGFNDFVNLWVDVGWSYESEVMVDDMAMLPAWSPIKRLTAPNSISSPSGVEVPCALT